MRFRKKPVIIEAFRYWLDPRPDWFCDKVSSNNIITYESHCEIFTLEGLMRGERGDWIVRGVKGEVYPVKPDIFEQTYEPVIDANTPLDSDAVRKVSDAIKEMKRVPIV